MKQRKLQSGDNATSALWTKSVMTRRGGGCSRNLSMCEEKKWLTDTKKSQTEERVNVEERWQMGEGLRGKKEWEFKDVWERAQGTRGEICKWDRGWERSE